MIWHVFQRVYSQPRYAGVACLVAALTLSVLLLFPNRELIIAVLTSPETDLGTKSLFLLSMFGVLASNFTLFSATYTVLIALLFGVNVSFLWYYIARSKRLSKVDRSLTLTGMGGIVSGIFGIGCAACGTIVLTGIVKLLGIAWVLTYLPLHGAEFGLLGVFLLALSVYTIARRIHDPLLCPAN